MKIDNTDFNIEQVRLKTISEFKERYSGTFTKTDINIACKMLGVGKDVKPKQVEKPKKVVKSKEKK